MCSAASPLKLLHLRPRPFFDPAREQVRHLCDALRAEAWPTGRRVDIAEAGITVEPRQCVEERPSGRVSRECGGEVLGEIAVPRAFRRR
jgi:hypothetical protein